MKMLLLSLVLLSGVCFAEEAVEGKTPSPVCMEPVDGGSCDAVFPKYYYNATVEQCDTFNYGGCEGNGNRFDSLEECQAACTQESGSEQEILPKIENSPKELCENTSICLMECAEGFEVDDNGCQICRCRVATVAPDAKACPLIQCPSCPGDRYVLDYNGCRKCECVEDEEVEEEEEEEEESDEKLCPPPCKMFCEHGKQKDGNGCEICRCNEPPNEDNGCPTLADCSIQCENGQQKDDSGCLICQCNSAAETATNCTGLMACKMLCPNGNEKDSNGCPICKCIDNEQPKAGCPLLVSCNMFCPQGKEKDINDCPICKCIETKQPKAECPLLVSCNIFCPNGQEKDGNGCDLCRCIDAERPAPTATCHPLAVSCTMACDFGFTKDTAGCRQCQCQTDPCEKFVCEATEKCVSDQNDGGDFLARCVALPAALPLICQESSVVGPCKGLKERFFYNVTSGRCQTFFYGGCGGNGNRFEDLDRCQDACRAGICSAVDCRLECPDGFEVDQSGCKVCRCRPSSQSTAAPTPYPCLLYKCVPCPDSEYVYDSNGCRTCECVKQRKKVEIECPELSISCTIFCPNGHQKDAKGCRLCKCIDPVQQATNCSLRATCTIYCPHGNEKDSNGCPTCKCIDPVQQETNCTLRATCTIYCPHGNEKDSNGCPTCKCIDPVQQATNCTLRPTCKIFCPNGNVKDSNGCPTCKCIDNEQPKAECSLLVACRIFCPHGQEKDSRGCDTCKCKDPVQPKSKCPSVGVTCQMECELGFARNADGCEVCKCQQDSCEEMSCGEEETCVMNTNDEDQLVAKCIPGRRWCHPAMCMMFCENGFKYDKVGCPVCSCLDHRMEKCKDVSWCTKLCEFGHQRDEHGCKTCECLSNPCQGQTCKTDEVCEAFRFRGCRSCPAVARCIATSDVRRLYIKFTYEHKFVRSLDVETFSTYLKDIVSHVLNISASSIRNVTITPLTRFKTKVAFQIISTRLDLVAAARILLLIVADEGSPVTFEFNKVTFVPLEESLVVMYHSSEEMEDAELYAGAVQSTNDDKVIVASCLVGLAFFAFCAIVMFVLYRRRRQKEKSNIIYKKAPTGEESPASPAKRI